MSEIFGTTSDKMSKKLSLQHNTLVAAPLPTNLTKMLRVPFCNEIVATVTSGEFFATCVLPYFEIMSRRLERLWLLPSTLITRTGFVIWPPSRLLNDNLKQSAAFDILSNVKY